MTYRILLAFAFAAIGFVSTPLTATAAARLTDQEVKALFDRIEHNRSEFEAALDDKLKNSVISGARGQVNANEFFDDFEDQVERARSRFKSDYSSSSEVLSLLQYATRLATWTSAQPAGFKGSQEWGVLATDLRRLAAAYNTRLPMPANGTARRLNDGELMTAAANVEKLIDPFRAAYDGSLAANTGLTAAQRQGAIQQVDLMKNNALALNAAVSSNQKGVAEADALLKQSGVVAATASRAAMNQAATGAWNPLRAELGKIAVAYEVAGERRVH